jgi:hypothetical protein
MFYIKGGVLDKIYWATSPATDGYTFTEQGLAVAASSSHDPFLWHNPVDGDWYLLWKENINVGTIKCRHAENISDLPSSPTMILRTETNGYYGTLAAPGIFYSEGIYYLTDESCPGVWQTRAFFSSVLEEGCFNGACECSNSPILPNGDACGFPHVEDNVLYYYWSHSLGSGWNLKLEKAILEPELTTQLYVEPNSIVKMPGDLGTVFDVNITIDNVNDLFGFDFNITWDKALLDLVVVDCEGLLDGIWGSGNWVMIKNDTAAGSYKLVALSTLSGFNSSAPQTLIRVTFRVESFRSQDAQTNIYFQVAKLSDSKGQPITTEITDGIYTILGQEPVIQIVPTNIVCRKYSENSTVTVIVADVFNATDFNFEIHYNSTLLDVANVTFVAWTEGNATVDRLSGNLTGYTAGDPITGNMTLLTITFNATYYHIWKNIPGWTNDLSDSIYVHWANVSFLSGEDLGYVRGETSQISVGPDVVYVFSPIQGDVDNDGEVDLFDLRTVAAYYDVNEDDPLWVEASKYDLTKPTAEDIIDVYDIVIVTRNCGFTY